MFLNAFSSYFNDILYINKDNKYKIHSVYTTDKGNLTINCEIISDNRKINFDLEEIIISNKLKFFSNQDIVKLSQLYYTNQISNVTETPKPKYLASLMQLFVIIFLASNIAASKLLQIKTINFSGGMLTFPLLYILNDVVTEVYGFKASRKMIWSTLFLNFILFSLLYCVMLLPSHSGTTPFDEVFALSPKIFIASMLSYLVGEFVNSFVLSSLKVKFKGYYFAIRAIISTLCGAIIDTTIFFSIVFSDIVRPDEMIVSIIALALIKMLYEFLLLPITVYIVSFLKREEKSDVFEKPDLKSLNPFI